MARRKQSRRRSPAMRRPVSLSWPLIWQALAIWIIPVQFWAAYKFFQEYPALSLRLTGWDLIGTFAYAQSVVLLEALFLTALFVLAALLLPAGWYRRQFVAQTFIFVLMTASWAFVAHTFLAYFVAADTATLLGWGVAFIVSLALPAYVLLQPEGRRRRTGWAEKVLLGLVTRLGPLSALYVALGVISLFIVLLRNLGLR